jgi:hypothetical protein
MMFFKALSINAMALGMTLSASALSAARADDRVGLLECDVSGGVGFVITSAKALSCAFTPERGRPEYYVGTIRRFGLDIGFTGPGHFAWAVFSASARPQRFALAGDYAGAGAGVTIGAGLGANALVGGNANTISLQPLSINVQTGLDVTAGVGALSLEPVVPRRR